MRDETLLNTCKAWMSKQNKLELFRDYNDYLESGERVSIIRGDGDREMKSVRTS